MVGVARQMLDTSSDAFYDVRDNADAELFYNNDSSGSYYYALVVTGQEIGMTNRTDRGLVAPSSSLLLDGYTERQAQLMLPTTPNIMHVIDTTSSALQQEKIDKVINFESLSFCKSHDLSDTLYRCLQRVEELFKPVTKIRTELSCFYDDDEFDNEYHIIIEATVNTSREIAESNYDKWIDWFVKNISDSVRKFFILTIDRE